MYPLAGLPEYWEKTVQPATTSTNDSNGEVTILPQDAGDARLQSLLAAGWLKIGREQRTEGATGDEITLQRDVYQLARAAPSVTFGTRGALPFPAIRSWPSSGKTYNDGNQTWFLLDATMVVVDPNYGRVTARRNVAWQPALADKVGTFIINTGKSVLEKTALGAITGPLTAGFGDFMDELDFLDYGDVLNNNAPGFMDGATDPFSDYGGFVSADDPTMTVEEMLDANASGPAFDPDVNNQGVMDSLSTGQNTVADSANLTDEPGSPSNNNGATPKGGGLNVPGSGGGGGKKLASSLVSAPSGKVPQITLPPYLPPNPRALQTPVSSLYNPSGGGMFPIYNSTATTGNATPGGTGAQPARSATVAPGAAVSLTSPIVLMGAAVLALVLVLRS